MSDDELEQWRLGIVSMLEEIEANGNGLRNAMGMLTFDLRGMVAQVVGWTQLLLEDPVASSMTEIVINSEKVRLNECLELILKSANRINAFQMGMSDYARKPFTKADSE